MDFWICLACYGIVRLIRNAHVEARCETAIPLSYGPLPRLQVLQLANAVLEYVPSCNEPDGAAMLLYNTCNWI